MINSLGAPAQSNKLRWLNKLRLSSPSIILSVLLLASISLLIVWSLAIPILDAPDEGFHWKYSYYIHQNLNLPPFNKAYLEGNSPPLYYTLVAPLAFDNELPSPLSWGDGLGHLITPYFPHSYINTDSDFSHYWSFRLMRLATTFMSLLTVWFSYLAGKEASGKWTTGLLAGGLVAFLPQFTFRGATISNDVLVTTLCAVALYLIIRIIRRGYTTPLGIITAIVVAGAFLSKINAVFLPVPFIIAVLSEKGNWRTRFSRLWVLGITLVLIAPWCIRNQILYGDPIANQAMFSVVDNIVDKKPITSPYFITVFPYVLIRSFIGVFGMMTIYLPEWIYNLFKFLVVIAVLGYIWRWARGKIDARLTLMLLTFPLLGLLAVININLSFTQPQGRYWFTALPAMAVLVALGLEGLPGWEKKSQYINPVAVLGLASLNIFILTTIFIPSYWPPPVDNYSNLEVQLQPTSFTANRPGQVQDQWIITDNNPQLSMDTDLDVSQYNFLTFSLVSPSLNKNKNISGTINFTLLNGTTLQNYSQNFSWSDDGVLRGVVVSVFNKPELKGRLKRLQIELFSKPTNAYLNKTFLVADIRLRGKLAPNF